MVNNALVPMQANMAAAIIFYCPRKKHLSKELHYFTLKVKSNVIGVWSFKAFLLSNGKLQGHLCYQIHENESRHATMAISIKISKI